MDQPSNNQTGIPDMDRTQLVGGRYSLSDLVDIDELHNLLRPFSEMLGIAIGLVDCPSANLLLSINWTDFCQLLHRSHPALNDRCIKSNLKLSEKVSSAGEPVYEKCLNGLVDGAVPVVIEGVHLADLYIGQVLFEPPDPADFLSGLPVEGMDREQYIKALEQVPVIPEEQFRQALSHSASLAQIIADIGTRTFSELESQDRFRQQLEENPNPTGILQDYKFIFSNEAFRKLLGYSKEEVLTLTGDAILLPEDQPMMRQRYESRIQGGHEPLQYETALRTSDGSKIRVRMLSQLIEYERRPAIQITLHDLSGQVKAEAELSFERQLMGQLLSTIPDPVYFKDASGTYLRANAAYCRLLAIDDPAEIIGRQDAELLPDTDIARSREEDAQVLASGTPLVGTPAIYEVAGEQRWYTMVKAPLVTESGETSGIFGLLHDVTELHKVTEELRERQQQYREITQLVPSLLAIHIRGKLVFVNPAGARMFGDDPPEAYLGRHVLEFVHPDDRPTVTSRLSRLQQASGPLERMDIRFVRADGEAFIVDIVSVPLTYKGQQAALTVAHDITDRIAAQQEQQELNEKLNQINEELTATNDELAFTVEQLREAQDEIAASEKYYRALIENSTDGVTLIDADGNNLYESPSLANITGYSPGELVGQNTLERIHYADRQWVREQLENLRHQPGGQIRITARYIHRDGSLRLMEGTAKNLLDQPEVQGIVINYRDVTERYETAERLRQSEEKLRRIFQNAQVGLFQTEISTGMVLEANDRMAYLFGFESAEDAIGTYIQDYYADPHDRDRMVQELRATGEVRNMECRFRRRDGLEFWLRFSGRLNREQMTFEGVATDITRQRVALSVLRDSEERFRNFIEGTEDLVIQSNRHGFIIYCNNVAAEVLGIAPEDTSQYTVMQLVHPADRRLVYREVMKAVKNRETSVKMESRMQTPAGAELDLLWTANLEYTPDSGKLSRVNVIAHDITEHKRLRDQLIREQKEQSIVTLAGGVAHDFNNILMGVVGSATLLAEEFQGNAEAQDLTKSIISSANRMVDLTNKLLDYARGGTSRPEKISLNEQVHDLLVMLKPKISPEQQVRLALSPYPCTVEADPVQLNQILLNLVVNALEAMPDGGTVTVRTINTAFYSSPRLPGCGRLQPGIYACIAVEDTGCGMAADVLARIFEPFYSTKFQGRGLGLAAVQGIVRAHEGCIFAESTLDEGTVFYVMLPAIATAAYEPVQAPAPRQQSEVQGSHVLVVDDEDIVLSITKRMLERRGLRVSTFSSASKALEYYREEYRTIDAVLFDITMPVLSGGDFVRAVHEINPEARCIAASGFEQEVALEEIDSSLISSFLHKPFQFHSLLGAIEDAIKGNGAL